MLLVVDILPIIRITFLCVAKLISLCFLPFSVTVLQSICELTSVTATVHPLVLAKAFRFAINILTDEHISISEEITTISASQAAFPFALVFVTIPPDVHSITLCL